MVQMRQNFLLWSYLHIFLQVAGTDHEYAPPTITLESCLHETIIMKISGATAGGLLYTRTSEAYNVEPTVDGDIDYICTFEECDINWNIPFYIVVQRHSVIQTKHDIIVTFLCSPDLKNISPGDVHKSDGLYDNVTVAAYKPKASMSIYKDGELLTSGSYVQLGTRVMMKIEITNNELDMFDFNVKSCKASFIELIEEKCSLDEELFPNFNKSSIATVYNYFNMFRPTTTFIGSVNIVFSCDLKVCIGWCPEVDCNDTTVEKRETSAPMVVGVMLSIGLEEVEEEVVSELSTDLCVSVGLFIGIITAFCVLLIANLTGAGICYFKCKKYEQENHKKQANLKPDRCKTVLENPAQNSSHSVNIKGMVGKKNSEYINQAMASETQTKTADLFNTDNEQNSTKVNGNHISNANRGSFVAVDRDLITASFKQFSSGLQVKLDMSTSQSSTTRRVLSILKNPVNLKPILKSRPKTSEADTNTSSRICVQKGDHSKILQGNKSSMIQGRDSQKGVNSSTTRKRDESSEMQKEEEMSLAKFLSSLNNGRRRSSIFKTESRENLLNYSSP